MDVKSEFLKLMVLMLDFSMYLLFTHTWKTYLHTHAFILKIAFLELKQHISFTSVSCKLQLFIIMNLCLMASGIF